MSERHQSNNLFRAWNSFPALPSAALPKSERKAASGWQMYGIGLLGALTDSQLAKTLSGLAGTPNPTTGSTAGTLAANA